MANIDLKKVYKEHYSAKSGMQVMVEVPSRPFLVVDGAGDPNTAKEYRDAVEALYPIAYGLRAAIKKATGDAYTVMPLEALWWAEDMREFTPADKSKWLWTCMICLPDAVDKVVVDDVIATVTKKKGLVAGPKVRVEEISEGLAAQVLHVGPYAAEEPTIAALHEFIADGGFVLRGKHHEIYLSDPRKSDPAKLRTIIRQPVSKP